MIREAVIVDAVRTPLVRRDGKLSKWHPVDLLARTLCGLLERNRFNPELIDDVIAGRVMPAGEQSLNIARNAVPASGLPERIPATTVDRQCRSTQQAIHLAAPAVMAGSYAAALSRGVERHS